MPSVETSPAIDFSFDDIMVGSKRLRFGQTGKTPPEMLRALIINPMDLSIALHELAHFHSLMSPLGVVLTTLSLAQQHWLGATVTVAREGGEVGLSMLKYLHCKFQIERTLAAYQPLLEGIAVFIQTSVPCPDLDRLGAPVETLYYFAGVVSGLDPDKHLTGALTPEVISQGILPAVYDVLRKGAFFPFAGTAVTLATEMELSPAKEWLPYFLGHAYIRGIHARVSEAIPEWECPEYFFDLLLRLLAAKRTGPKYELTSNLWVDMVYGWNRLFREASDRRIAAIARLSRDVDILEWLLDEALGDEEVERLPRLTTAFLAARMPDWKFLIEGAPELEEVVLRAEQVTRLMNLSERGPCRLLGRMQCGDLGSFHVLDVGGDRWWMRVDDEALLALGVAPSEVPLVQYAKGTSNPGYELTISAYVTAGTLGLGDPPFPGHDHHYLFWIAKEDDARAGVLTVVQQEPGLPRLCLHQAPRGSMGDVFQYLLIFRRMLEDNVRVDALIDQQSMRDNLQKQDAALSTIRSFWTEQILFDLLGPRSREIAPSIVSNRMRDVLLDTKFDRHLLTATYGGPALFQGQAADDATDGFDICNSWSAERIGHDVFARVPGRGFAYKGLWGSSAWSEKRRTSTCGGDVRRPK